MLKQAFVIAVLLSMVLISGCVQQKAPSANNGNQIQQPSPSQQQAQGIEDQAANMIEQEMENAIGNMSVDDIENSIAE